jgi:hypothetical protein
MSKRKGRRQPLTSEIKSLRRPARGAGELVELEPPVHASEEDAGAPAADEVVLDLEEAAPVLADEALDAGDGERDGDEERSPAVANGRDAAFDAEEELGGDSDLPSLAPPDADEPEDTEAFLMGLMEALLFTSQKPLPLKDLARSAGIDRPRAKELLERLIQSYRPRGVASTR